MNGGKWNAVLRLVPRSPAWNRLPAVPAGAPFRRGSVVSTAAEEVTGLNGSFLSPEAFPGPHPAKQAPPGRSDLRAAVFHCRGIGHRGFPVKHRSLEVCPAGVEGAEVIPGMRR